VARIIQFGAWTWKRISDASVAVWLWGLPVSGGFSYWAWVLQWGYLPIALTGLGVLVATIWGFNGIVWLRRQRRPSKAQVTFDYSYALALEEVVPSLDVANASNTLEVRLKIRNHANGPMKFMVERLHTTIGDRFWTMPAKFEAILPRAGGITLFPGGGFTKEAFDKFADTTNGGLEFSILYGHPEDNLSRRATKTLKLNVFKRKDEKGNPFVLVNWVIESENDVAV
jgi:hypothetical protein